MLYPIQDFDGIKQNFIEQKRNNVCGHQLKRPNYYIIVQLNFFQRMSKRSYFQNMSKN